MNSKTYGTCVPSNWDAGDAVTGTAEYKVCAVRLEPVRESEAKQVFPGAYAAAGV